MTRTPKLTFSVKPAIDQQKQETKIELPLANTLQFYKNEILVQLHDHRR